MKRSAMIEEICDIVHAYRRSTEAVTSVELAEIILDMLEQKGMLPPLNYHSYYMDGDNGNINDLAHRSWEKEDE